MVEIRGLDEFEPAAAADPFQHTEAATAAQEFRQLVQAALSRMRIATRGPTNLGCRPPDILIDEAAALLDRAASLAHQLAAVPSPDRLVPKIVFVQHLIVGVGDRLRRTLGSAIRLQTCVSGGTPAVRCAPQLLEEILIDLAITARGAMPYGGVLLIESRMRYGHDRQPHGPTVCVTVTGTGTATGQGRAPSIRPEPVGPLSRPTRPDHVSSLGFGGVRRLVEEIGGVAESERLPGGGNCVRLHLPACSKQS
jgi:signal transduction histidine kinase